MRLEFALTVVVVGVIAALALGRIAELRVAADGAGALTQAAQSRSAAALAQAREPLASSSSAAAPCRVTPASAPLAQATSGAQSLACP